MWSRKYLVSQDAPLWIFHISVSGIIALFVKWADNVQKVVRNVQEMCFFLSRRKVLSFTHNSKKGSSAKKYTVTAWKFMEKSNI